MNEEEGCMLAKKEPSPAAAFAHLDRLLDDALEETFPASDAVAIDIERPLGEGRAFGSGAGLAAPRESHSDRRARIAGE
jgi:hypothetical protein